MSYGLYQEQRITGGIPGDSITIESVSINKEHVQDFNNYFLGTKTFNENGEIILTTACATYSHSGFVDTYKVIWHGVEFVYTIKYQR